MVRLKSFDNQCVRITDSDGCFFDGICSYNNADYNEHEFGRREGSLQIVNFLFYESDIKSIESLEEHTGPYGKFLDPFGKLEEMNVEDGLDSILDVLYCEENEHVLRMLRCLDYHFDPKNNCEFPCRWEAYGALMELEDSVDDEAVREETNRLLNKWRPA
ncbi:MAG: hypothetical protein IJ057_05330 [Bacteroidales bacterium]|nr:hypothetical protein [Bacteroidales bacterium]